MIPVDPVLYYLGLTGLLKYSLYYLWKDKRPANAKLVGHVKELLLYPVKSCRGISQPEISCDSLGGYNGNVVDRSFGVMLNDQTITHARMVPQLLKIQPKIDPGNAKLTLSSAGHEKITVDVKATKGTGQVLSSTVYGSTVKGRDCGDDVGKWLDHVLNKTGCRLLYRDTDLDTRTICRIHKTAELYSPYAKWIEQAKEEDKIAYHDLVSIHLVSEESLADLNSRLADPVQVNRFRPNIVVSTGQAYEEDRWKVLFVGDVRFTAIWLANRCTLPLVDPETCIPDKDNEPIRTLEGYRKFVPSLGPQFGLGLVVDKPGVIKVGDPIYLVKTGDIINVCDEKYV